MGSIFSRVIAAFVFSAAVASAGPNKAAELYIDCAPATPEIDSLGSCVAESSFTAGVFIRNASKLYSYQYSLAYDAARLRFVKAVKGSAECRNFLESKGQSMSFKGNKEQADSTRILIAGWLSGDDTSQCTDGTGCLALVTFQKLGIDTTALSLGKLIILDCGLDEDTACVTHGASIVPGILGAARFVRLNAVFREGIEYANGKVRIRTLYGDAPCRASISDVSGREIIRFSQGSTAMEADMKRAARGMYFISIVRGARISSYPLMVGR